jgi:hypothetical protein
MSGRKRPRVITESKGAVVDCVVNNLALIARTARKKTKGGPAALKPSFHTYSVSSIAVGKSPCETLRR